MADINTLLKKVIKFRDARDWKQFHNPKDVALSMVLEAGEVMEHFQWKSPEEIKEHVKSHKNEIGKELSDVLYWILLLSYDLNIDLSKAFNRKLKEDNAKYPVSKAKGKHLKYTELK